MTHIAMTSHSARYLTDEQRSQILRDAPEGAEVRIGYARNPGDWTCRIVTNDRAQIVLAEAYHAPTAISSFIRAMATMAVAS